MPTPNEVFESLEEYMLPFNLRQCFDAFRLRTIYHIEEICPPEQMRLIRACFDALAENKAGGISARCLIPTGSAGAPLKDCRRG